MSIDEKTIRAALRIRTEAQDPAFLSEALGVEPSRTHLRGDTVSQRRPDGPRLAFTTWIYDSPLSTRAELAEHITYIVTLLEDRLPGLDRIRGRITTFDIFCMFSSTSGQGSAELDAALLIRLAALKIDLIIDLYPPSTVKEAM
jgi:hypothetical protein